MNQGVFTLNLTHKSAKFLPPGREYTRGDGGGDSSGDGGVAVV